MEDSIIVMSLLGAAIYNGIGYATATDRKSEGYSLFKAARTGFAGILQTIICSAALYIVPDSVDSVIQMPETIWNGIMVGMAGTYGLDKGLKYVGIKN